MHVRPLQTGAEGAALGIVAHSGGSSGYGAHGSDGGLGGPRDSRSRSIGTATATGGAVEIEVDSSVPSTPLEVEDMQSNAHPTLSRTSTDRDRRSSGGAGETTPPVDTVAVTKETPL
jgi:hypothetical protein